MTTQEVDPDTFYTVGTRLFELAGDVYDAFAVNVKMLGETGAMAGTDDAGTAWAASYDGRANEVLGAVNDLTVALENYGGVLIQAGYNHAVAEYNATASNQGPPPQRPPEPASVAGVLSTPPSAGGPGKGLFDNALGLVEQVGVPVPDGDTVKVDKAAQAWDRLATVYQTTTVAEALEVNARAFSDTHSPEVEYIDKDLRELRDATSAILAGCSELAQSCKDYRAALDDLRNQLEDILTDLAVELAVTATITVLAACVSFGAGAVAGAAKAAHTISKFAKIIRSAASAWKVSKRISEGVKKAHDIASVRKRLERIKSLGRKQKPEEPKPAPSRSGPEMTIDDKQFGQKVGKHARDYGLDPADPSARAWVRQHIEDIRINPDEVRQGVYHPGTGGGANYWFYRQGNDILITKENGEFVTIFRGAENSRWFQGASPR